MTIRYLRQLRVLLLVWSFVVTAAAQTPWQVTVTPTMNPLPIGFCVAVHLTVRDSSGAETPRNGLGARISIADFDMSVTAPGARSVAGQQIDASHWSVCACTGAAVGAVATVTASYPAQSLPAAARIPGVAFRNTATFVIAPAKGSNPPACTAPPPPPPRPTAATPPASSNTPAVAAAPKVVSAPAPSTPPPTPAKPAMPAQQQQQPAIPAQIPEFPNSAAAWAALQASLGSSGWAQLQQAIDRFPQQAADDKAPPRLPDSFGGGRNHAMAVAAFKTMLPVLRHARCANCHMDITYFDDPGEEAREFDSGFVRPASAATHKGNDINEIDAGVKDSSGNPEVKLMPCQDCHTKAPPAWVNQGPDWSELDDYQLCQQLKDSKHNGDVFLDHLLTDDLIKLGFQGQRAMDLTPQPPPMTYSRFLQAAREWIDRMDAMKQWPKARSEGCPRTDAWSGSIEYTYTEVTKLDRYESHGAVHIVGGLAKWSALAARQEDHSAKNCRDVFTGAASGGGEMQLVTIDYTSEMPVTGFKMPVPGARPKPGATAPTAFVGLTIYPGKYGLSIDLPMEGSGSNQGGGSACPGYKSHVREFNAKIGEGAGGKFDPDNPDEISGTMTSTPYPGASITMKWQFMRQNEDRGR